MKDLDGRKIKIGELLSPPFFFRIPEYQRPFSWDADNFDDLIDDLISANRDQDYFLGTIVLHQEKDHFDVVDGQQRLASLLIVLACLRDLVADTAFKDGLQAKILQQKNVVDAIPQRVRLEVKDRQIFSQLVETVKGTETLPDKSGMSDAAARYVTAISIFREKLLKLSQDELQALILFITQRCVVIYLATTTFDDAFRLFTIVNDRGKQLRRIDVLKAMNIAPNIISKPTIRDRVAQEWETFENNLGEGEFENVFHLARLALLKDKPQGDLVSEFENRIFPSRIVTRGEPFFNLIFEYAALYTSIFEDKDIIPLEAPEHTRFAALIHIMKSEFRASEWRACLLQFAKKFGSTKLYEFCLKLEKVYLAQWVNGVRKDERYGDYSKILGSIDAGAKAETVIEAITYDSAAIQSAAARPHLYGAGFAKYFLLRLELVTAEHEHVRAFTAKSIEHVLPQNPAATGYWASKHDLTKIDSYVDSIGNLVLLSKSKNSSAQNFDFDKKKEKYLKSRVSDYPRSIQVLEYPDWDKAVIDARTADAQKLILQDP
jgi:hypothetical protein